MNPIDLVSQFEKVMQCDVNWSKLKFCIERGSKAFNKSRCYALVSLSSMLSQVRVRPDYPLTAYADKDKDCWTITVCVGGGSVPMHFDLDSTLAPTDADVVPVVEDLMAQLVYMGRNEAVMERMIDAYDDMQKAMAEELAKKFGQMVQREFHL